MTDDPSKIPQAILVHPFVPKGRIDIWPPEKERQLTTLIHRGTKWFYIPTRMLGSPQGADNKDFFPFIGPFGAFAAGLSPVFKFHDSTVELEPKAFLQFGPNGVVVQTILVGSADEDFIWTNGIITFREWSEEEIIKLADHQKEFALQQEKKFLEEGNEILKEIMRDLERGKGTK